MILIGLNGWLDDQRHDHINDPTPIHEFKPSSTWIDFKKYHSPRQVLCASWLLMESSWKHRKLKAHFKR